jgi:hypothetical protein
VKPRVSQLAQSGASTGQALVWNGTEWAPAALTDAGAIPKSLVDAKGDLLTATANDTPARLPVGSNGQLLSADSAQSTGLAWVNAFADPTTTKGDLLARTSSALARLAVGTDGQVLTADAASTPGVKWANPAGAASGGLTQSYLGTNSVGGSWESLTNNRYLMKKITLASAGQLSTIDMHLRDSGGGQVGSMNTAIWSDSSGTPGVVVAMGASITPADSWYMSSTARWVTFGVGAWLAAGDYWIGGAPVDTQSFQLAYAGSGSDRYFNSGGTWLADATSYSNTTTSNDYSIRASIIR